MNKDDLLTQLQAMSGGSLVMSTEQLAKSLSMNPKVISRMRQEGRFPISHKSIGSKIVYPIASVANYLFSDEPEPLIQSSAPTKIEPSKRRASSVKAPLPDLSRKMLMRGFVSTLEAQQSNIDLLVKFFKRKEMAEELQSALPIKPALRKDIDDEKFSSLALTEQVVVILFRGGVNIKSSIERAIATVVGIVLEDEGLAFRKGRKPDQVFMNLAPFLQEKLAEGAIQPFQAIPYKSYVAVGMEGVVAVFDTNVGATEPWERKKS
jgi:hypothetical protein